MQLSPQDWDDITNAPAHLLVVNAVAARTVDDGDGLTVQLALEVTHIETGMTWRQALDLPRPILPHFHVVLGALRSASDDSSPPQT